jgi:hypothetical protein
VHDGVGLESGKGLTPQFAHPPHRMSDVVAPELVVCGDHQIEPDELTGPQEHSSAAGTSTDKVDAQSSGRLGVDRLELLR